MVAQVSVIQQCGTAISAYLLGSIPFGYIAARLAGVDIRREGSGNIGATNVLRVLGRKHGYAVFTADTLKGLMAVRLALWVGKGTDIRWELGAIAGACAVIGHAFPVWLRFRGGKGVATSVGACFGLLPLETLLVLAVWLIVFALFRFVSLASIAAAAALPVSVWLILPRDHAGRGLLVAFAMGLALLIIVRHRSNIRRLLRGTEPKFERK